MDTISVDFETHFNSKLKYGLKQQIAEEYCRSDHFDPYLISVYDGTTGWSGHPRDFCWSALDGALLLSHNKYFDYTVWLEMARRKLAPNPNFAEYHCTANLTSYLCNRRALADAVEHLYGVKADKDYRLITDGKHWADFTPEEQATILRGGISDARWCWKFWTDYSDQWPEHERRLSNQTIAQGMRGVAINTELLDKYVIHTHSMLLKTEQLIPWVSDSVDAEDWDEFNTKPTSTKCIAEQCRRSGIPCPPVKSDDAEGYEEWEATYATRHPWIEALTNWRSLNKMYKTFLTAKQRVRADGTMPFGLKYFGAHTGRWSGDAKINFQNFRKVPILMNEKGHAEQNIQRLNEYLTAKATDKKLPEWVKAEIDFRRLIIPRPGKKMILSDLAQIEPRVLAWLTGNMELLDKIRGGMSIYEAFARTNMGYTGGKMDKASLYYKMIKIQVLGLGYGAGWKKFIKICADGGVDITEGDPPDQLVEDPETGEKKVIPGFGTESRKVVETFRTLNPRIKTLWDKLDYEFKTSIGTDFVMELPSGRKMRYGKVMQSVRFVQDEKTKKPKKKWVVTADIGGRRVISYGGKLTENLVQATAREVFGHHLIGLEDCGHTVLFSSHDEAILETDASTTAKDIEGLMSVTPEWIEGCPIAAEAKEVEHYEK